MNWICKTCVWVSLGCVAMTASALAQQATWPPAPIPLQSASSPLGITLGRPTPILDAGEQAIQQSSYVARGVSRSFDDEPKTLILPRELPPTTPVQSIQDKAKPAAPAPKPSAPAPTAAPKPSAPAPTPAPKPSAPAPTTAKVISERVIVLDECCCGMGGPAGQWLSWLRMENNQQWYGSAEFLLWTTTGANLPALVTTASPFDPEATRAALGFGTTQPLLGPGNTLDGVRPGARFTVGYNFDPCGLRALEASFFFLTRKNENNLFDSDSTPVIGRPFFNLNTGTQDRELTTSPGILPGDLFAGKGTLAVNQSTTLLGAELNKRWLICDDCCRRVTGLIGFRYLDLADTLRMEENITIARDIPGVGGGAPIARAGDRVFVFDHFDTQNRFYGGQVGVASEWRRGRYVLEGSAKVGLGATVQSVDIDGGQRIDTVAGGVQSFQGGLYALPSNIGHHRQTRFAVVPEVGLKLGYQMTDNVRFFVGYDFLYWSSVLRAGEQIDQAIDVNQVPNAGGPFPTVNQRRPAVLFQTSSYWAHGMNAGFEIRY